jgi:hypothetical protein
MASWLYRDHLILYVGNLVIPTQRWTADILIAWRGDSGWDFQTVKFPQRVFEQREEAETFVIRRGKNLG